MIGTIFEFGGKIIEVRIDGDNCLFRTEDYGGSFAPIEGLNLDKKGSIKENPDLKDREDWKEETIKRFKEKLKSYETEKKKMQYIIEDLRKFGYKPKYMQLKGHRPIKIK